jgi:hypothetical protein
MWRTLETELRRILNGHKGGNPGYKPRMILRATAPASDPTNRFVASVSPIEPAQIAVSATPRIAEPGGRTGYRRRAKVAAVAAACITICLALGVSLASPGVGAKASRRSVAVLGIRDLSKGSNEA